MIGPARRCVSQLKPPLRLHVFQKPSSYRERIFPARFQSTQQAKPQAQTKTVKIIQTKPEILQKGLVRKLVVSGGVAGGASCAARARRLDEKAKIVVFEKVGNPSKNHMNRLMVCVL
jgi:hypothetical protein